MNKKVYIIGAGGHTRSLVNLLEINKLGIAAIYDDSYKARHRELICGYGLKGAIKDVPRGSGCKIVISIGDNQKREELFRRFYSQLHKDNLKHKSAIIENRTHFGVCNQIFARVYINSGVIIKDDNILNTGCTIEHESRLGSHNHVSVCSVICGRVTIGNRCLIGTGAVVINKIRICDNVIIGANSVVVEDITRPGVYIGNPAKRIK